MTRWGQKQLKTLLSEISKHTSAATLAPQSQETHQRPQNCSTAALEMTWKLQGWVAAVLRICYYTRALPKKMPLFHLRECSHNFLFRCNI